MIKNLKLKSLELGNLIIENETHVDWENILGAFEFDYLLDQIPRLVRSQYWGDPDYKDCIIKVIYHSIEDNENNAFQMIQYILNNCTELDDDMINKAMLENNADILLTKTNEDELNDLISNINNSLMDGKPVFALDRLHTLMHKWIKESCLKHDIEFNDNEALDILFKKYVNYIDEYIESQMTKTILKSNISLFSQFNNIRNNYTWAHDNDVLNDIESKLIFKNIVNVKIFVEEIENKYFYWLI